MAPISVFAFKSVYFKNFFILSIVGGIKGRPSDQPFLTKYLFTSSKLPLKATASFLEEANLSISVLF